MTSKLKNLNYNSVKNILLKNSKHLYVYLDNRERSSFFIKNFYFKIFFKFNWIRFNFYLYLFWNYLLLTANRYYFFSKAYYLQSIKYFCLRDFNLFLYLNTPENKKNYLVKLQTFNLNLVLSQQRKKANDRAKLKRITSIYNDYNIPWQLLNLSLLKLKNINFGLSFSIKKLNNIKLKKLRLVKPLYINLYNQKYLLSGYMKLKHLLYKKFDFPYNLYYTHHNEVTIYDVYFFLNKFCGIFVKSGKRSYPLRVLKLFNIWAKNLNLNFYDLIKFFIFNYIPFVYLKVLLINRRRVTRPTLLTKEKSFFLAIKWWKEAAIVRKERSLAYGLFLELIDINSNKGLVVTKFNNLLLATYNARSDLKVRKRRKPKFIFFNKKRRKFLNEFIYNTVPSIKFNVNDSDIKLFYERNSISTKINTLYDKNVIKSNKFFNRVLNNYSSHMLNSLKIKNQSNYLKYNLNKSNNLNDSLISKDKKLNLKKKSITSKTNTFLNPITKE